MKLTELHPTWDNVDEPHHYLTFDCPAQHENSAGKCMVVLPVKTSTGWQASGRRYEDLTVTPSIWHHCEKNPHFWIKDGEIVMA